MDNKTKEVKATEGKGYLTIKSRRQPKVDNGTISVNQDVVVVNHHDPDKQKKVKISKLYEFDGLNKVEVKEAGIGSIVAI